MSREGEAPAEPRSLISSGSSPCGSPDPPCRRPAVEGQRGAGRVREGGGEPL